MIQKRGVDNEYSRPQESDRRYDISPERIHSELGWLLEIKFEDGMKHTIRWNVENRE